MKELEEISKMSLKQKFALLYLGLSVSILCITGDAPWWFVILAGLNMILASISMKRVFPKEDAKQLNIEGNEK